MKDLKADEKKYCGECVFFCNEDIWGMGLCEVHKTMLPVACDDKACTWFKERKQE